MRRETVIAILGVLLLATCAKFLSSHAHLLAEDPTPQSSSTKVVKTRVHAGLAGRQRALSGASVLTVGHHELAASGSQRAAGKVSSATDDDSHDEDSTESTPRLRSAMEEDDEADHLSPPPPPPCPPPPPLPPLRLLETPQKPRAARTDPATTVNAYGGVKAKGAALTLPGASSAKGAVKPKGNAKLEFLFDLTCDPPEDHAKQQCLGVGPGAMCPKTKILEVGSKGAFEHTPGSGGPTGCKEAYLTVMGDDGFLSGVLILLHTVRKYSYTNRHVQHLMLRRRVCHCGGFEFVAVACRDARVAPANAWG
ncbi:hypothetical protein CYMTET_32490 [Cymbomonas tetramitiformis]|uniref:Uncharacterized protein n=1 Tax=Cymbomonas tetramitiformis TaxID=36881 RepID=A0AAE0FF74_9CHLO|nr:hypothetical protein CYMTET_32490 [Cymbomonas tetramitiformis]